MPEAVAPLTPPDCDLRDFAFMPLDVVRLRDSDLVAMESAEAFRAAVMLWCASWHQLPAASLPDDDRVLANLAGYGRVVKEWQKERDGALRGWVKCSDGRLYHPVVAEKAIEAWREKAEYRIRKERRIASAKAAADARWHSDEDASGMRDASDADANRIPPAPLPSSRKGEGQGQGQGTGIKNPSGSTPPDKPARKPKGSKRVPADFQVSPDLQAWAAEKAPLIDWKRETEKFRDWEFQHARTDWDATWRTWMRKAQESAETAGKGRGSRGTDDWTGAAT